jgi:proline dehydrogenase
MIPLFPKKLIWIFSKRYIAGRNINEAVSASKKLNAENMKITVDLLGEFISDLSEATKNKEEYLEIIERFEKEKINGNYSLKPTSFGLLLDKDVCYNNVREIVVKAAEYNNFLRVDMEDSPCVDLEIEMYRKLKAEFPDNVGLVLQSYMRRTMQDVEDMMDMHTEEAPLNFRLCKGIYVEPKEIAYKKYEEVNENYIMILDYMLRNKIYVGIATHDKPLVKAAYELIEKYNVPKDMYEFQMLYGVTPDLRQSIVDKGHTMRVYVPFGDDWFGYSTRRLKENPKMANHIIKALFVRG